MTPEVLKAKISEVFRERRGGGYNYLKAFKPYWWHKLQTGRSETEESERAGLKYPILVE